MGARSARSNYTLTRDFTLYSTCIYDMLTLRQKLISLRTSMMETSWGVVTMIAPSTLEAFKNCAIEMCSSDVLQQAALRSVSLQQADASDCFSLSSQLTRSSCPFQPLRPPHEEGSPPFPLRS